MISWRFHERVEANINDTAMIFRHIVMVSLWTESNTNDTMATYRYTMMVLLRSNRKIEEDINDTITIYKYTVRVSLQTKQILMKLCECICTVIGAQTSD